MDRSALNRLKRKHGQTVKGLQSPRPKNTNRALSLDLRS